MSRVKRALLMVGLALLSLVAGVVSALVGDFMLGPSIEAMIAVMLIVSILVWVWGWNKMKERAMLVRVTA